MPLIEVSLYDRRVTDETAKNLIEKLTDALVECTAEELRATTLVMVHGLAPKQWGIAGEQQS